MRDAVEALWTRQEALTAKGIIAPHRVLSGRRPADQVAVRNLNRAGVPETVAMKITAECSAIRVW